MEVKAVAYVRVSTQGQVDSGLGLDSQRSRIEAYASFRRLELVEMITDPAVSGSKPLARRDGGARLLRLIKARKATAVVALKLDRLFRNTVDCLSNTESWERAETALHIVDFMGQAVDTGSAAGKFMLTVFAAIGELERGQIAERTSAALTQRRARGLKTGGGVPYGFCEVGGGRLEPHPAEQECIAVMRALRAQGHSLAAVADFMNRRGVGSKLGSSWSHTKVARAIRSADAGNSAARSVEVA